MYGLFTVNVQLKIGVILFRILQKFKEIHQFKNSEPKNREF